MKVKTGPKSLQKIVPQFWMAGLVAIFFLVALVTLRAPSDVGPQGLLLFFFLVLVILTSFVAEFIKRLHERHNYRGRKLYLQRALTISLPVTILFALSTQGTLNIFVLIITIIAAGLFSLIVRSNINSDS